MTASNPLRAPVTYIGGGVNHIEGVPSRDLSPDEWESIPMELREKALAAGTHKFAEPRKTAKPTEKE